MKDNSGWPSYSRLDDPELKAFNGSKSIYGTFIEYKSFDIRDIEISGIFNINKNQIRDAKRPCVIYYSDRDD